MKKKTVITTEKREVWFIRQPGESSQESDDEAVRPQGDPLKSKPSLAVPAEQTQPEDPPPLEKE